MNVAKKKRWLRGDELLESRDIYLKEEFPQRLILSCICPIAVTDLTLFFIYICIYLHTYYTHYNTSHHITSHVHYLTECFRNSLQFGRLFGFPLVPVFPCYLQRIGCSIFHFARCFQVFPLFLTLGFSFCAVFAVFWNMDVGFCILELQPVVWSDICSISPPK